MIIYKHTVGYVVQAYDTVKKEWVKQEFISGDQEQWEYRSGALLEESELESVPEDLPFFMIQPNLQIVVTVEGGNVQVVDNVPLGAEVVVIDYDTEGCSSQDLRPSPWSPEELCRCSVYHPDGSRNLNYCKVT